MLVKKIEKYINEFVMMEGFDKFKRKSVCFFKDGMSANNWFNKYENDILSSSDSRCLQIKQQYDLYVEGREKARIENGRAFYLSAFSQRVYLREFMEIKDSSKFDPCCDIILSNNENAYVFFMKIRQKVLTYNDYLYDEVKVQYNNYKKQKLKKEYKTLLFCFYKEKRMGKFDIKSTVKLIDNISAGSWFDLNKNIILSSDLPIEKKIQQQYEDYLIHYDLALEFLQKDDIKKFDMDSNVRFSSRALMNMWWQDNEEKIRYSDLDVDNEILKQYDDFVKKIRSFE